MAQEAVVEGSPPASASGEESGEGMEFSPEKSPALAKSHSPIAKLMERTGYSIVQQNGQRRYGPPPDWDGSPPPRGSEVFIGKIPRDCFEDELVPVFERVGRIYEMRLMMDFSGHNRGYAFVVYGSPTEAKESVRVLNNFEIRKGRTLGICMSVDNCRLFVGGIPKKVTKEDIRLEMQKVTEGVTDVIVYPSASDKTKNRGFAFVEYDSHRAAAMARRKLMNGRIQLWGHNIAVDWAEPELEVDEEVMAQVKVLYVRNLMLSTTENEIEVAFGAHATVERVKKIRDYAFIHFTTKADAHAAMEAMNGTMLDGAQIEVTLAKPVDRDSRSPRQKHQLAVPAFGFVPVDQYGGLVPAFYPGYYSPPKYMMRNSMGACAMLRVGRSSRGRGRGYYHQVPFSSPQMIYPSSPVRAQYYTSPTFFDASKRSPLPEEPVPTVMEIPTAATLSIKPAKSSPQILEEICQKNNWGSPLYTLHSTPGAGEEPLFLYKVTIAAVGTTYLSSKLSRHIEEARSIAAEYTLVQLGYPMEAAGYSPNQGVPLTETPAYPTSFVAIQSNPKTPSWGSPAEPTLYAPTYTESPFPPQSYASPEVYRPGF